MKKMNSRPECTILRSMAAVILLFLPGLKITGQDGLDFSTSLGLRFTEYCSTLPREEMYVHTDREDYVAGEDMWFTAYLFNSSESGMSAENSLAYVEILNPENRPVVQKRIRIEKGTGPGMLDLPDSLGSGIYTFRAYTGWMRNFLPGNCFMKPVYISNALSEKKYTSGGLAKQEQTVKEELADIPGSGLRVSAGRDGSGNIRLTVNSTGSYRSLSGNTLYLFIRTRGGINLNKPVSLPADSTVITIPKNILTSGINHITLFSASGRPVFERMFYTRRESSFSGTINTDSVAGIREAIDLAIERPSSAGTVKQSSISVSAAGGKTYPGIDDYMVFGSEYGLIPDEIYRALRDGISSDSIDKMVGGLRSSWINWKTVLSPEKPEPRYSKETSGHFIYGSLQNRTTQQPDTGQVLFLSVPGKNAVFRYAVTDKDGYFRFEIPSDQNYRDLVIQPEDNTRNNTIRLESPFSEKYPPLLQAGAREQASVPANASRLQVNYQVMKIYGSDRMPDPSVPVSFTRGKNRFYGKPDIELILADYIKLPVMHEVFFELMPGVFMKERRGVYEISLFDPVENRAYEKPPVLFVDGVVVKDAGVIAGIDPELVERIDAVKSRYVVGEYLFFGLVNVITKTGDFSNIPLPDQAIRLAYQAYGQAETFSEPDYGDPVTRNNRIPDFRNTLYWNPSVTTGNKRDTSVRFWTSDFRGPFEVLVQGVTDKGEVFSFRKIIKVQ